MAKSLQAPRYRPLPQFLRNMRLAADLTQRELAARLHMNHTLIHKSETAERRVDLTEFVDWARACELDPLEAFRNWLRR